MKITHTAHLAPYRANSEDRALVLDLEDRIVILVADGAGEIFNGGAAAGVVVELVEERAAELVDVEACIELLQEADQLGIRTGGETTAVLIVIDDQGIFGASAGIPRRGSSVVTAPSTISRRTSTSRGGWAPGGRCRWGSSVPAFFEEAYSWARTASFGTLAVKPSSTSSSARARRMRLGTG